MIFDSETEAIADFLRHHPVAARPGPAPPTDIERAAAAVLAVPPADRPAPTTFGPPAEQVSLSVPSYAAAPGDHQALLRDFFTKHQEWEKWRPHDETTIASHESLTLRVEFPHEALRGDAAWTIAAYESPVGERLWHATATPTTPVEIMRTLLDSLTTDNAWSPSANTPVTEEDLAQASRPLEDVGWHLKVGSRLIDWTAPAPDNGAAGLRFDTSVKQGACCRPGPSGAATPSTAPTGPFTSPRTPPQRSSRTSPSNSPTVRVSGSPSSAPPQPRPTCRRRQPSRALRHRHRAPLPDVEHRPDPTRQAGTATRDTAASRPLAQ